MSEWVYRTRHAGAPRQWLWASIFLLLAGLVHLFAGVKIWQNYRTGEQLYAQLGEQVTAVQPEKGQSAIDFDALRDVNPQTAAWLKLPALELSLPVVQPENNKIYLHTGFDGKENPNGCLFFSALGPNGAEALYSVIYGHNMHSGSMFGRLTEYKNAEFALQNQEFLLYTPDGDKTCRIFSCHEVNDGDILYKIDWQPGEEYAQFLQELKAASLVPFDETVQENSRVLTLSTCASSYGSSKKRFVIHAVAEDA